MQMKDFPFELTDWEKVEKEEHAGEKGVATWRIRRWEDSPIGGKVEHTSWGAIKALFR